jgi:hypothetical protein
MSRKRRQREIEREARQREAEDATAEVDAQGKTVDRQLSLVDKLSDGWRRVHQVNHLAQLFNEQGRYG